MFLLGPACCCTGVVTDCNCCSDQYPGVLAINILGTLTASDCDFDAILNTAWAVDTYGSCSWMLSLDRPPGSSDPIWNVTCSTGATTWTVVAYDWLVLCVGNQLTASLTLTFSDGLNQFREIITFSGTGPFLCCDPVELTFVSAVQTSCIKDPSSDFCDSGNLNMPSWTSTTLELTPFAPCPESGTAPPPPPPGP